MSGLCLAAGWWVGGRVTSGCWSDRTPPLHAAAPDSLGSDRLSLHPATDINTDSCHGSARCHQPLSVIFAIRLVVFMSALLCLMSMFILFYGLRELIVILEK